jgi:apolipoprotein N-acyltransferase
LNRISVQAFKRSRYPTAIAAGVLLGISFPQTGVAGFAWIAPGLMLLAAWGKRGLESFRIGYVAGLAHYLTSLRWLLLIPVTGFPILGWIALSAYLALYPAAWVWLSSFQISNFKFQISNPDDGAHAWLAAAERLMARGWSGRMLWALSCGASWVALEMLLTRLLGGFPWNLLGVSQHRLLPLIQFASLTGVCGVSFLVVWTSVSLLCAAAAVLGRPNLRSAWMGEIILPFVTIVALFVFGFHRLRQTPAASRELSVTLVQPSIPQTLIWDARENTNRFLQEIELSERALAEKTDLLIWPEGALPQFDQPSYIAITNLIRSHHVWMLFGADDVEPRPAAVGREDYDVYNAAFLFDPQGRHAATYRKRSLVIFGEYIPLEKWLPFIKWFTPIQGSYTPGNRPVQLELRDREAKTSALICFEDVFPQLGREAAGAGHGLSCEPDQRRLVRRRRGPMAARRQRAVSRDRKRPSARPLHQYRPDLLVRSLRPTTRCLDGHPRKHLWPGLYDGENSAPGPGSTASADVLPSTRGLVWLGMHGDGGRGNASRRTGKAP